MELFVLLAVILRFSFASSAGLGSESDFELANTNTTNNTGSCWTPYYNDETPSSIRRLYMDDFELLKNHYKQGYSLCEKPISIQCVTPDGVPYYNTSDKLTCVKEHGLICFGRKQASGICQDYKVRYLCPGMCKRLCGSSLFVPSGERTINPPESKAPASCQWTISTLKHQLVKIRISSIRLMMGMNLTVYDGKANESVKVVQLRSEAKKGQYFQSRTIYSSSTVVQIQYSASHGGVARWMITCTAMPAPLQFSPCHFNNGTCNWKSSNKLWKTVHCHNNRTGVPTCGSPSAGGVAVLTNSVEGSSEDTLQSPCFKAVQSECLSFRYLISGLNTHVSLEVVQAFNDSMYSSAFYWKPTDNKWRTEFLKVVNDVDFYVLITVTMWSKTTNKTTNVKTYSDYMAIDEIRLEKCVHDFPCVFMDGGEVDCPLTYKQGHGVWSAKSTTSKIRLPPVLPPESFNWVSLGCWHPSTCASPLPSLERNTDILEDYPSFRSNPVARCAVAAYADSQTIFAVQRYGQCHSVNKKKLARDYKKSTEQCSVENLEIGSYEIFNITAVRETSPATYQTVVDDVFKFVQDSGPSHPIYRSSISFKVVPPRYIPGKLSCISFRYITSFRDTWIEMTSYTRDTGTGISKRVWKMPDVGNDTTPVWRYANIMLPSDTDRTMELIEIMPFKTLQKGKFRVMDLVGSYPCVAEPRDCLFNYDLCGWQSSRLHSRLAWGKSQRRSLLKNVTGESGSGYVVYNGYSFESHLQREKDFVTLWHPTTLSKGHRCLAFHYVMPKAMKKDARWGFSVRVKTNGKIYSEVVPNNASGEWQLGKILLPKLRGTPMQIEFRACWRCSVALDNFIFSYQSCKSDKNECKCSKKRQCDHICINTFGSFFCRCREGYRLDTDNRTCIPVCTKNCFSGKCVAPYTCECPKQFTGTHCQLTCGETYLRNKTGTIRSPKFINSSDHYYQYHRHQCDWIIRAPPGHVVTLEIEELNWHSAHACYYHNLTIRNKNNPNRNGTTIAVLCAGQLTLSRFLSPTNKLFVSYHYISRSFSLPSFNLKYQVHEATGCIADCSNLQWWQQCCFGYLVAVPNVFRQGTNTTVDVRLQKIAYAVTVKAELVESHQQPVQALISGHGSLTFQVPDDLSPGKYLFKVVALNGEDVVFNQSTEVAVAPRGPTVLVQTDKPVYKPGQTVRMRILSMDYNMKPYNGNLSVVIADGKGTKVLQWLELTPINGIIVHSFVLSSQPVAGMWKITISNNSTMESVVQLACFEVREYVLPKFETKAFTSSSYIVRDSPENIRVAVSARYSYGKSVKGSVCLRLTTVHISSYYYYNKPKMQSFCKQINGLTDFTVDLKPLIGSWSQFSYSSPHAVEMDVTVTEKSTGVTANSFETIPIVEHEYILSFKPGTNDFYKPGLPFTAWMSVATPDQQPAGGLLLVNVTVYDGLRYLYQHVFDDMVNGTLKFNIFHWGNRFQSHLKIQAIIRGKSAKISHVAYPQAAASEHYMTLTPNMTTLQAGIPSTVFIMTTRKVQRRAFAMAVSRARILKSWRFKIRTIPSATYEGVHDSTMLLTPLCSWGPRFHLVAYYVVEGNLVVADSISLNVEVCFQHRVEMTFSRNESRPGEKLSLFIQSAPHSHVSLTGVDKSVYLLDSDCSSQITADQVFAELLRYETGKQTEGDGESSNSATEERGSALLSTSYSELNQLDWWIPWWDATNTSYYFKSAGIAVITDYLFFQENDVLRLRRGLNSLGASGTGGNVDEDSEGEGEGDQFLSVKRVRSYFPEAWLWEDKQTDENGKLTLNVTVPDTITTWIADAFALSNTAAFGMTNVPSSLVAFKPFFVSLSLPYSVVRREEVEIIATVFNYYHEDLQVLVELDVSTEGFDFVIDSTPSKVSLLVRAQDSLTARFPIRPRQLGHIPLKVTAYSRIESDAIIRLLLVEPEGIKHSYSKSSLITGQGTETMSLNVPDSIVPESFRGDISLSGDVMGPAIKSLGSTLSMPYGCGEQNMINFAPAVLIKRYLTAVGSLTAKVDARASHFMSIGYQRELTYQRSDGSYAVWGNSSSSGSTCLTGFVCWVYAQATPFMYIDPDSLEKSVCWLISQQAENGQFSEPSSCSYLQCGRNSMGTTLTAYTLISLLEVSRVQTIRCGSDQDAVQVAAKKSQVYLERQRTTEMNDYVLAMTAYSLSLAKSQRAASLLTELDRRVGGKDHWTCGQPYCYGWRRNYCRHDPGTVEATAYAMLAYLEMGRVADIQPMEAWLVSQMDSRGGYRSTQDTVMALMALSEMATQLGWQEIDLTVTVAASIANSADALHTFRLNTNNKLVTQTVEVDAPTTLNFHGKGVGNALLQVTVSYNVPEVDPDDSFSIIVTAVTPSTSLIPPVASTVVSPRCSQSPFPLVQPTQLSPTRQTSSDPGNNTVNETVASPTILPLDPSNNLIHLDISSSWQRNDVESGMSVIEVGLLSGYRANQNELHELVENNDMDLQRYETVSRKVVLYFDKVKRSSTCFTISQQRTHCVAKIQPAFIQAYSYYEPDYLTTVLYQPPPSLGDSLDECTREMEENAAGTSQLQTVASGRDDGDTEFRQDDSDSASRQDDGEDHQEYMMDAM